jgi:DNA polymerase III subunit epsilon
VKPDHRGRLVALIPGALLGACGLLAAAAIALTMDEAQQQSLWALIEPRIALLLFLWLLLALAGGAAARALWRRYAVEPAQMAETIAAAARSDVAAIDEPATDAGRALARAANDLLQQRAALQADIDTMVDEAVRDVAQERSRLAALMAELTQSVLVCNLDGRILLYNQQALHLLQTGSADTRTGDAGSEWIGIGRSIYAVFDRALITHALEVIGRQVQRGNAQPSAQFVAATRGGPLLRVQVAPVRAAPLAAAGAAAPTAAAGAAAPTAAAGAFSGFVLVLDDITREQAAQAERDRLLIGLTEGSRASLGNLQAAAELLDDPQLDAASRERFLGVIRDEAAAMSARLQALLHQDAQALRSRWPLQEMHGADLLHVACRHIESRAGCSVEADECDAAIWLRADGFLLLQALASLAARLHDHGVHHVRLRLARRHAGAVQTGGAGDRCVHLDLLWAADVMLSADTVIAWEAEAMRSGADRSALSVRDVVERHAGEFWHAHERTRHESMFRFLLPLADAQEATASSAARSAAAAPAEGRPEFYDFDLFQPRAVSATALGEFSRPLAQLSYTVFDTETTGLDPGGGDEILQIGATRIVNGRLLRSECFDSLVNPQRTIAAASTAIHGIDAAMVAGQPTIAQVLPAFHAFAADTVLVGHNVAFDMRFLQLKEAPTGIVFSQPVLDTLLLAAVAQPNQPSQRLEALAQRLGVSLLGRHTALGDALVTAEVFLKLLPLLADKGIVTLGEAIAAAQKTYLARLKY